MLTITLHVSCSGKLLVELITSRAIFLTWEKLFANQLFHHREIFIITRWSECLYITSRNFSLVFFSSRLSLTVAEFFRTVLEFQRRHFARFTNMINPTIHRKWKRGRPSVYVYIDIWLFFRILNFSLNFSINDIPNWSLGWVNKEYNKVSILFSQLFWK